MYRYNERKTVSDKVISEELAEKLQKEYGLSSQQVNTVTARAVVKALTSEGDAALINNAQCVVREMEKTVESLRREYLEFQDKFSNTANTISATLQAVLDAQKQHGQILDERTADMIAAYCAIIDINKTIKCPSEASVKTAGYIMWALLTGKAKLELPKLESTKQDSEPLNFKEDEIII